MLAGGDDERIHSFDRYINKTIFLVRLPWLTNPIKENTMYPFAQAAITKYHRPGCLKDRTPFSHVLEAGI